jgi:hypothetical protein
MNTICKTNKDTNDLQTLYERWFVRYVDIMSGSPPRLLPLREINHKIPLIDDNKHYSYQLPHCPEVLHPKLMDKLQCYIDNGWWTPKAVFQATLLLCILKKSGGLRMVMDCCQRNDNTHKDVTPFPDQDQIQMDVARTKY